eukprot:8762881-Pyramimonas_sp.AAC.1
MDSPLRSNSNARRDIRDLRKSITGAGQKSSPGPRRSRAAQGARKVLDNGGAPPEARVECTRADHVQRPGVSQRLNVSPHADQQLL